MSKAMPSIDQVEVILSDESSSDGDTDEPINKLLSNYLAINHSFTVKASEDPVLRKAEVYQDYMKQIPIPSIRGSIIPFHSWTELAKSMKQLYEQPLHYLTNVHINMLDKMRIGVEEDRPLDTIIHPCKAETAIWLVEETHRSTTSPHYLAKLWHADPVIHASIDAIFPSL